MSAAGSDGAAVRIPPPLIFAGAIIGGGLLHTRLPLPGFTLHAGLRIALCAICLLAGSLLMVGAMRLFKLSGQDPRPWKSTPEIVSSGVYRFSRNPMYVGMALIQAGIGIGASKPWVVALVPLVLLTVYVTAVRHEEAYLQREFGETYTDYRAAVRRWL